MSLADDAGSGIGLVILGLVLLPVTIVLAILLFEWLFVLLLLPLAALAGAVFGRPVVVVARQGRGDAMHYRARAQRHRYARVVRGWRASGLAIDKARAEIAATGAPESLGESMPLARPPRSRTSAASAAGQQWLPAGADSGDTPRKREA
jgi:hypothetical protein